MRRLLDALLLLFAASNGYHILVGACRFLTADRHLVVHDLRAFFPQA